MPPYINLHDPPTASSSDDDDQQPSSEDSSQQSDSESESEESGSESESQSKRSKKQKTTSVSAVSTGGGGGSDEQTDDEVKLTGEMDSTKPLASNIIVSEIMRFSEATECGYNKDDVIKGLELIDEPKRRLMEDEWMQIKCAEMEVFARRAKLINDMAQSILQDFEKSSKK